MKFLKKWKIILMMSCFTFYFFGLCSAKALRGIKPGDPAPDFKVVTLHGQDITLENQKGKILVLAFWKRGQNFSKDALADLVRISNEFRDKDVTIVAINGDKATLEEIKSVGIAQNLNYPLASDPDFRVYGQFGVFVLPSTLIIGQDGKLESYHTIHSRKFYSKVRGHIRLLLGELNQAQLDSELNPKKIERKPEARKKANLHVQMGRMLMGTIMKDKAREEFIKAIKVDPTMIEARTLLATIYLDSKDVAKARPELEQALKLDPSSQEAQTLMDRLEIMEKQ